MKNIRIVTDSTCDIPADLIKQYQIEVVPAYVNIGDKSFLDGVDLSRPDFYNNLTRYKQYPTTAAPAAGMFAAVYEKLTAAGASATLSLHISETLSSIINSARAGTELAETVPVTVYDSRQLSMGLGFQVLAAAQMAEQGATIDEILISLAQLRGRTHIFCLLDSLDAVRRGGRINWIVMSVGNILKIKPIVHVYEGEVLLVDRVRTRKKAMPKLIQHIEEQGAIAQLALLNTNSPDLEQLADLLKAITPAGVKPVYGVACPAIGVHVGAGAIALGCVTAVPEKPSLPSLRSEK